jgi:predicted dehydrogenase
MANNISLIGLGYIGKIHLKLLAENPHWQLNGIYDVDRDLTLRLADQYKVRAFDSLDEAISSSGAVDIASTSSTHFEIAKKSLQARKHVFIEKPVTSELAEARQLSKLVLEAGVVFQVGHVERFNPAFLAARPYISEPVFLEVHRLTQYNNRGTDVSVVLDLMMHDIDLILSIVNSPVKNVSVSGTTLVSASHDIANARIEFADGCVANITTNRVAFRNSRRFRVFTKKNLVNINLLDKTTEVIRIKDATEGSKNLVIDPGNGLPKKEILFEHPVILPTNAINEELNTFYHSINSKKASSVGIEDAIRTLEVAFMIEEKLSC